MVVYAPVCFVCMFAICLLVNAICLSFVHALCFCSGLQFCLVCCFVFNYFVLFLFCSCLFDCLEEFVCLFLVFVCFLFLCFVLFFVFVFCFLFLFFVFVFVLFFVFLISLSTSCRPMFHILIHNIHIWKLQTPGWWRCYGCIKDATNWHLNKHLRKVNLSLLCFKKKVPQAGEGKQTKWISRALHPIWYNLRIMLDGSI